MVRPYLSWLGGLAICAGALLAAAGPASAATRLPHFEDLIYPDGAGLPRIANVAVNYASGTASALISGVGFGSVPPSGIPCNACTPIQLQVLDLATYSVPQSINVVSWSDTSIAVTGIAANPGDALEIDVYNQSVGNAATWGGLVSKEKGLPKIASVKAMGTGQTLVVTVNGSGFGPAPAVVGQNTNSPYFMFSDINDGATGFGGGRWNAGFCGANECDGVTMGYLSWIDTQIVMSTFGGAYGSNDWFVEPSDAFCVAVWPSTSQSNGTTGADAKCGRLPKR